MTTITISVRNGAIVCTPKHGNLRVNPRGRITWKSHASGQSFRLTFHLLPFEGMPPRQDDWPFEGAPPETAPSTEWRTEDFSGTVSGDGVFKYDVEVKEANGNILRLDPIIIIRN